MEFEVLKRSHLKRNIIIGVIAVLIISAIILNFTRAKYRSVATTPLIHSVINYSLADLNIVAVYIKDGEDYTKVDTIPEEGYTLNQEKSYCKVGDNNIEITINYDTGTKTLSVSPLTTKGTKCYLYFDEQILAKDAILANATTQLTRDDFSVTVTEETTGTIYYTDTKDGRTYYFAGNPTDNWVSFAGFYWRIIRINEDGSIRMIYMGTDPEVTTGEEMSVFNGTWNNNMYVGYMYQSNQVHGLETDSAIKGVLDEWYENNLLDNYSGYISHDAGFCGDRQPSTSASISNGNGGTGTTATYYGAYIRLNTNKAPTFECQNDSDLYTVSSSSQGNHALDYPIGLITADEVAYAGGVVGTSNSEYYLYINQNYWTMTPYRVNTSGYAIVLWVDPSGNLGSNLVHGTASVYPVINLRSDVTITGGNGSSSTPFDIAA